jgi:hypothetical protein
MITSEVSPMSEEFHEWLDQCPVQWYRNQPTNSSATHVEYGFEIDTE